MQNSIKSIILVLALSIFAYSQNKESAFDKLKSKFENAQQIYIEVEASNSGLKGFIKAQRGNKYQIVFGDRQIVSNGESVWNYSKPDKQVLISSLDDTQSAGIENIFFELLDNVEVKSLKKKNSSDSKSKYVMSLHDKIKDEYFTLELDSKYEITALEMQSYDEKWQILKLNISDTSSSSNFEFSPADSIEVIDLR